MGNKRISPPSILKLWHFFITQPEAAKKAYESYHLVRRKYIVSHAAEFFSRNKLEPAPLLNLTLLDIGCGTSKLAEEMTFRGADVTAIDASIDCIENAKQQAENDGAIVNFLQTTPEELVKQGRKFHIILCMDIFEYVDHTSSFMKNLKNLLHDDGIILFSSNNRNLKSAFIHILCAQWLFGWVASGTYKFKRFRTPEKLIGKFNDNGFNVIDLCGVYLDIEDQRWKRCPKPASRYLGAATCKTLQQ